MPSLVTLAPGLALKRGLHRPPVGAVATCTVVIVGEDVIRNRRKEAPRFSACAHTPSVRCARIKRADIELCYDRIDLPDLALNLLLEFKTSHQDMTGDVDGCVVRIQGRLATEMTRFGAHAARKPTRT